jgi:hypothetical protein
MPQTLTTKAKAKKQTQGTQQRAEPIHPQKGPQEAWLSSSADIAIYGGAAGGGKTFALLMEACRHAANPAYAAVIFRRTYPEVTAPGGLWPESMRIYPLLHAVPNGSELSWRFPSGAFIKFGHLQYSTDILKWLGAQIALIGFDQLETFTGEQFWYMLSRNRSTCGVRPYIRATANPQPGWLADFLSWWIDPASGYPISERSGVLRWFVRKNDELIWGDDPKELQADYGTIPRSVTFVPALLSDNKKLMEIDPGYLSNLQALPRIDRERLEKGNWRIANTDNEWPAEFFDGILFDDWPADVGSYLRVSALDPSKGKQDGTGDYSAWIELAVERESMTLWVDADLDNKRPVEPLKSNPGMKSIVTDGIERYKQFAPCAVLVEINGFQSMVADALLRWGAAVGVHMPIYTVNHLTPKAQRISSALNAILAQRRIRIRNTPGGRLLLAQLRDFRRDQKASAGIHDDGPDALAAAIEMGDYMLGAVADLGSGIEVLRA